jgi:hypothetical protein
VCDENAVTVLDFVIETIVKVCRPSIRLAQAHGRTVIFIDDLFDENQETASVACMDLRRCYVFRSALDLRFGAASRTLWGTSRHLNLLHLPVNLRVVFAEPGKAKDHGLLAQRGDCELGSLCMTIVVQHNIGDLGDGTCFICGSINVVDRDRRGEAMGGDVVQTDILSVDEKPSSAAVDECTGVALHHGVRHLNFNVDVKRVVTWVHGDDESLW